MPEADLKLARDVQRMSIDFDKATPLAAWEYHEVDFSAAHQQVTIRHKIEGRGRLVFLAAHWRLPETPTTMAPVLYTLFADQVQFPGYIKVRSTVAGQATILIGLRRDG